MPRDISEAAMEAMLQQNTDEVFLVTLDLMHTRINTIYIVNDLVDHVIGANTYIGFPFKPLLPSDDSEKPPRAKLSVSNVDRSIITQLRTYAQGFTISLAVRLASQLTVIEYGPWVLEVCDIAYTEATIEMELTTANISIEPYPKVRFIPSLFPGIFQ